MGALLKESLHQVLDTISTINMGVFQNSLEASFEQKKIQSQIYSIERVDLTENKTLSQLTIATPKERTKEYELVYESINNHAYRVEIDSLVKTVLYQMVGTLLSTFIIFTFLLLSFWYLFKTILKLKTVDEMKDDFINNMTHELKTPIAVAYSAADTLLNFGIGEEREKRVKYLSICKEELGRLSELVEQIMSMSVEQNLKLSLKREKIEIKKMLDSLIEQHMITTEKDVQFTLNVEPDNLTINADRVHLNNAIGNLIDNAIKYSGKHPTIKIEVLKRDGFNTIRVQDNGIGIPPEKQKFIFDKFYRVPQGNLHNAKGYGIGLYYMQNVVERHNGTVEVTSTMDKGTQFTIKLPVE